jgi:tetratricopeptide (TPR) repeat protein
MLAEVPIVPTRVSPSLRMIAAMAFGLIIATFLLYSPVSRYQFINYDDPDYVQSNPIVKSGLTVAGLRWAFTTHHAGNWHPLTWISHMLDCQLFGVKPGKHHLVNALFHALNAGLLFLILNRITRCFWRSAFVAALFAFHPLRVESVAWISERKDVLSAFFGFVSTWFYIVYAQGAASSEKPKTTPYSLSVYGLAMLFFAASLLSKATLVTLPFVWVLLDYWPLERTGPLKSPATRRVILEKIPFLLISFGICVATYAAQTKAMIVATDGITSRAYQFSLIVNGYADYLLKLIYPARLAIIYPMPPVYNLTIALLIFAVLLTTTVIVWRKARTLPWLAVGWFWYLGTFVPMIGIIKVGLQAIADRYTYIPSIGIFVVIAWGAFALAQRQRIPKWVLTFCSFVILGACAAATANQLRPWENGVALFEHAIAVTPNNYVAHSNLGLELRLKNEEAEAEKHFREALRITPMDHVALFNLGGMAANHNNFEEATKYFKAVIALKPDHAEAHNNLGDVLARQNKLEEAAVEFREAIRLKSGMGEAHRNLGGILFQLGKVEESLPHGLESVRLLPDDVKSHFNYACELIASKETPSAIQQLRETLRLDPKHVQALNELAWILATDPNASLRNGTEAVELAERACELTRYAEPPLLGTLDASYAEAGRFGDAIKAAEKTRAKAEELSQVDVFALAEQRLTLYRLNRPFHAE